MSKDENRKDGDKKNGRRISSHKPKADNFKKRTARLKDRSNLDHRNSALWALDCDIIGTPFRRRNSDVDIAGLMAFLQDSATARSMLFDREDELRSKIAFDDQTIVSQYYPDHNTIVLNPDRPMAELACVLIKEMRRAWQHQHGHLYNPLNFTPDEAILVNRAQQADSLMMAIRVAWELKLLGRNEMWNFMIGAPFADVTRSYEIHARNDFRSLNDGRAGRAAYDKWFDDHRTKIHDKRVIHQMLLEDNRYVEHRSIKLESLTDAMLHRIADVPGGRNYMSIEGHRAPTHADYMEIEDRSNANFLWFVKFERNFQEKESEIELMETSVALSAEIIDFTARVTELRHK